MADNQKIANENEKSKKELKEQKKQDKKKQKEKAKKDKKPGIGKKVKDSVSELKKVTWPTFANVVKKTGVVILVVLIFTVVLFGIDYLLGLLSKLLIS